jgi:DNA-binding CsgD family transcriptional regulator/tetratricopeptide (TPR) repeat protein
VYSAPLVCRDEELQLIRQQLMAARSGRGGATFVIGEGGIGKSRLSAAAAELGAAADMRILRGRGRSIGPMTPFRLLTEILISLQRSGRVDIERLGPYRPALARLVPDWGSPAHGDAVSLVILSEAVLRLTELAGERNGCLIILDDLHNADAESLAVVDYLTENLAGVSVLLIGAAATEESPGLDLVRSAAQRGSAALLELRRLGSDEVRILVGGCLECDPADVPAELAEHLWADSGGVPLLVSEILDDMVRAGVVTRSAPGGRWRVTRKLRARATGSLTRNMAARLDKLNAEGQNLLSMAAVLGMHFPVSVLQAATGLGYRELVRYLHTPSIADVIVPDEDTPDWYAFQHPLVIEALLSLLTPDQRAQLAARAADAVEAVFPGVPGEWCQTMAALRLQAGDHAAAGPLFTEAGQRALAQGAASTAVALLDKALEVLPPEDVQKGAETLASLLLALSEAGMVERAVTEAARLDHFVGVLSRQDRAQLHTRLAWAAAVAGRSADGLAQVEIARQLLGPDADARDVAPVDMVAAHLALDLPGTEQVEIAERLARRAATVAEGAHLPIVACQSWQLLGALSRTRDPAEATECLEHALSLAVRYQLPIEEIHAQLRLGNNEALRDGSIGRLEHVREVASRVGAVTTQYQAEVSLGFHSILRGQFAAVQQLLDQVLESTSRLNLIETTRYAMLNRAILAAHRGRRDEMDTAFAELRRQAPEHAQHTPRAYGLARTWCALLEEDRPLAIAEQDYALAAETESPTVFPLAGRFGLHLLLLALEGKLDWEYYDSVVSQPAGGLRWDRQFALLARARLLGREGREGEAASAVEQALRAGEIYPTGRNLGLRLVAEAAIADGWGAPVEWLRTAEEYFHSVQVDAVASACRSLMRREGVRLAQRRTGHESIPADLRAAGITVREYEVFQLIVRHLGNREIAGRLHLSPRTVEKHVAALLRKTAVPNRAALSELPLGSTGNQPGLPHSALLGLGQRGRGRLAGEVRGHRGGFEDPPGGDDPGDQARRRDVERRIVARRALRGAALAEHVQDLRPVAVFDDHVLDARRAGIGGFHQHVERNAI